MEEKTAYTSRFPRPKYAENIAPPSPVSTSSTAATTTLSTEANFSPTELVHSHSSGTGIAKLQSEAPKPHNATLEKTIESVRTSVQDARKKFEQLFASDSAGPKFEMKETVPSLPRRHHYLSNQEDMMNSSSSTTLFGTEFIPWPTDDEDDATDSLTYGQEEAYKSPKQALATETIHKLHSVRIDASTNSEDNMVSPSTFVQSRFLGRREKAPVLRQSPPSPPLPTARPAEAVRVQNYWNKQIANRTGKTIFNSSEGPDAEKMVCDSEDEGPKPKTSSITPTRSSIVRSKIQALEQHLTRPQRAERDLQ
jgi:hypothetical protein